MINDNTQNELPIINELDLVDDKNNIPNSVLAEFDGNNRGGDDDAE